MEILCIYFGLNIFIAGIHAGKSHDLMSAGMLLSVTITLFVAAVPACLFGLIQAAWKTFGHTWWLSITTVFNKRLANKMDNDIQELLKQE